MRAGEAGGGEERERGSNNVCTRLIRDLEGHAHRDRGNE